MTGEKPHVCGQCGESFAQSGTLKEHVQRHTGIKPFQCQLCSTGFSSSTHLNRHQRNVKCSRKLSESEAEAVNADNGAETVPETVPETKPESV